MYKIVSNLSFFLLITSILIGTLAHYDPVILPPSSVGFFQSHLGDPRKAIMDACCKALKAYIPFVVENGWLSMENLLLSSDISNKGSWIASIFTSLKEQSFVKISKTHQKDIVAVSAESIEKVCGYKSRIYTAQIFISLIELRYIFMNLQWLFRGSSVCQNSMQPLLFVMFC